MPRYTCTDGFKGSLHVSNGFELLRGTQCNDVTLSNTLAGDRRGNHGLPSKSSSESGPGPAGGPGAGHDGRDTLCVCPLHQHWPTLQSWLISRTAALYQAAVRRHIAASKQCFKAGAGFREIQLSARPGDGMAGAGGGAGPAPDVRHQRPGEFSNFVIVIPLKSDQRVRDVKLVA